MSFRMIEISGVVETKKAAPEDGWNSEVIEGFPSAISHSTGRQMARHRVNRLHRRR